MDPKSQKAKDDAAAKAAAEAKVAADAKAAEDAKAAAETEAKAKAEAAAELKAAKRGPRALQEIRYRGKTYGPGEYLPGDIDDNDEDDLKDIGAI